MCLEVPSEVRRYAESASAREHGTEVSCDQGRAKRMNPGREDRADEAECVSASNEVWQLPVWVKFNTGVSRIGEEGR